MRVIEDTSWKFFLKKRIKKKAVQPVHVDACFEVVAAAKKLWICDCRREHAW